MFRSLVFVPELHVHQPIGSIRDSLSRQTHGFRIIENPYLRTQFLNLGALLTRAPTIPNSPLRQGHRIKLAMDGSEYVKSIDRY